MKRISLLISVFIALTFCLPAQQIAEPSALRPMTFLDVRKMKRAGSYAPSKDGNWLLYTVTTPNWEDAKDQSDIHLVSLKDGISSNKQMTYTKDKSEKTPKWLEDGGSFIFSSDRDGDKNQLFLMRTDGGEARKITEAKEAVSDYKFTKDRKWLAYKSGESGKEQLFLVHKDSLFTSKPTEITKSDAGISNWDWSPDGTRIYFTRPNESDEANRTRKDKGFTVDVKNYETPLESFWFLDLKSKESTRITEDDSYTIGRFNISDDGKWISYSGVSANRYKRNITEQRINSDLFLYEVAKGNIERLTNNEEVSEGALSFSPDGRWIAFVASDDMSGYNMRSRKVYLRSVTDSGGTFKKLGTNYDDHVGISFWSEDGNMIYFNTGVRATRQLLSLDIKQDVVKQVTQEDATLTVSKDKESGVLLINYSDPKTPRTIYTTSSMTSLADRSTWTQLTDVNPEIRKLSLGEQKEITYTSTDGKEVGGVLILPVDYQVGQRYPLVVSIHGGPAGADLLVFNEGSGGQVYAGAGYAMFCPNYRGSSNYGEQHRIDIVGNYFPQAYDDIMSGVDYLIDQGIVDSDQMGVIGWSAGGHWANWILTHTDRFKAISSGAGTMNWISMYAQSDVQRNRRFYLGDDPLYENFDAFWEQSPLKYIKNAKTPTMIHVVGGDPRVPSPQSAELHMALKKLGVDTEFFVYPGKSHGIPDTRNRLVKSVSEMAWLDHYVRGIGQKFSWNQVLETLESEKKEEDEKEEKK